MYTQYYKHYWLRIDCWILKEYYIVQFFNFLFQADNYFAERCPMAVDIYDEIELDGDETLNKARDAEH